MAGTRTLRFGSVQLRVTASSRPAKEEAMMPPRMGAIDPATAPTIAVDRHVGVGHAPGRELQGDVGRGDAHSGQGHAAEELDGEEEGHGEGVCCRGGW